MSDPVSIVENFLDVSYPVSPAINEAWETVKKLVQRSDNSVRFNGQPGALACDGVCSKENMKATLENILCIIHRDGGHYINTHGLQKAFDDALELHYRQREAMDEVEYLKDTIACLKGENSALKAKLTK